MRLLLTCIGAVLLAGVAGATPVVTTLSDRIAVEAAGYRACFWRDLGDMTLELRATDGTWQPVTKGPAGLNLAWLRGETMLAPNGCRATWAQQQVGAAVLIGRQAPLDIANGLALELHCFCTDDGLLIGGRLVGPTAGDGCFWSPPRLLLDPDDWDGYAFWAAGGQRHAGALADLQPFPAYAGVSAWGPQGDTVSRLDAARPALIVRSTARGTGLGTVFMDYDQAWSGASSFLQRHTAAAMYLYSGYIPTPGDRRRWAWLAPFPPEDEAAEAVRIGRLLDEGRGLLAGFEPLAPPLPAEQFRQLPDFPAELRRAEPVRDINEAIIYTVGENALSDYGLTVARKVGTDVIVRGWFKWAQAPAVDQWRHIPQEAHRFGALFGGGITCSALYDNENGITPGQLLDMATRNPAGELVDAWDQPGVRHGSLSSPAYRDYLLRWCREQMDAGVDYLFMDEITAALSSQEGFDDHSLRDFRRYLLEVCPQTQGWALADARWQERYDIALADPAICPTGQMDSFDYRAYMGARGLLFAPHVEANRLSSLWWQFGQWRDDWAWRELADRIRAYARELGRTVLLSGNGIAPYVDLQVLGVWGKWTLDDGHISLAENQLPHWRGLVTQGHSVAGKRVPVVLFHDWGFGETPFPWLAVAPSEREVWMRTRGAEIYAAGGFLAFPVLGPFNDDAARDGTLPEIVRQTTFYRAHSDLYLQGRWLGCESLQADGEPTSLAAWWHPARRAVLLHVINRDVAAGKLRSRAAVKVRLPLAVLPQAATVVSPDFTGERPASCRLEGDALEVALPGLEAYSVALLSYGDRPDLSRVVDPDRVRPHTRWVRPARNEFPVLPGGGVRFAADLEGFLQGMLHTRLRNPPTFVVNATQEGQLGVRVRCVASGGARLVYQVDGRTVQTVDLPDLDGRNDANAEYDRTFLLTIPAGRHRLALDNTGPDWALIGWYEFRGQFGE
jgi:hypothetical protein